MGQRQIIQQEIILQIRRLDKLQENLGLEITTPTPIITLQALETMEITVSDIELVLYNNWLTLFKHSQQMMATCLANFRNSPWTFNMICKVEIPLSKKQSRKLCYLINLN